MISTSSYESQIKGIRLKISQTMKQKKNLGVRLTMLRKSKLRTKESKSKKRYLERIKTIVIQVDRITKRSKALRQQLKQLNSKGKTSMATQLKTKLKTRHVPMVSVSATLVKTLAGAQAYKAKRKISVEDDKHITDITRGETFYLKHDVKRKAYVLFDVDQDDNTIYKFIIDKATYNKLVGAHTELGSVEKKPTAKKPAKPSRPKARKPQDYKDQVPFDRSDRTNMVQTIFQGSIKTTPTSMTVTIDMDVAQVKREAKKAGFRVLTTKGSVVKFVHADGTQMDVAVKEDYLAVRFN